jgi:hypothetical protein
MKTQQEQQTTVSKRAILINEAKIGNNELKIYIEPIATCVDFSFTINDTFLTTTKHFSISELYQIYCVVQETLINYIENTVLTLVESGRIINLVIDACGDDIDTKNKIYERQIQKLANKYNCLVEKDSEGYILTFGSI